MAYYKPNFFNPDDPDSWDSLNREIDRINSAGHSKVTINDSNEMVIETKSTTIIRAFEWYKGWDINILSGRIFKELGYT